MKKKILLIDDSVTIHRVIDLCVDKEKYDVVKVFSKDEAAVALKTDKPDLVLLDNKLLDIKTVNMVQIVKEASPSCYVILLAGAFDQFDKAQCDITGADDFIYKPFDAKTLDAKIACGLDGICEDTFIKDENGLSDDDMHSLMPEVSEETELPVIDESEEMLPTEELVSETYNETVIKSVSDFAGLKEIDEEDLLKEPKMPAEDFNIAEAEEAEPELELPKMEMPEIDVNDTSEEETGNPFDGLVEMDEEMSMPKAEAEDVNVAEEPAAEEAEDQTDDFDNILDGINEESEVNDSDLSMVMDAAEETISRSERRIDVESAFDGDDEQIDMPEDIDLSSTVDLSEAEPETEPAADATTVDLEMPEQDEAPVAEETEDIMLDDTEPEPEADDLTEEDDQEMMIPELAEEALEEPADGETRPPVYISQEKLVEAVYEAIDEDTLKFAIKEVLTDKITRILEDELPYLVEKAIRKEIERLVKGS